jgi:hypothetical protein
VTTDAGTVLCGIILADAPLPGAARDDLPGWPFADFLVMRHGRARVKLCTT